MRNPSRLCDVRLASPRHGYLVSPTVAWRGHVVSCDVTLEVSAAVDTQSLGAWTWFFRCFALQHVPVLSCIVLTHFLLNLLMLSFM